MLLEILPNVWYDTEKQWYEQDEQLIKLAEIVMQEVPKSSEMETSGANNRLLWAIWEHTTSIGTFDMRVDRHYLYPIVSSAFLSKKLQDTVIITQI